MSIRNVFCSARKGLEFKTIHWLFLPTSSLFSPTTMCKVHTILDATWLQASWPHFCAYPRWESNLFSDVSQKDIFCWSPWIRSTKLSTIWNLWAINSYTWHWLEPDLHVFHSGCWKNAFSIFKILFFKGFSLYCSTEKQFYFTDFTCEKFKRAFFSGVVLWVASTKLATNTHLRTVCKYSCLIFKTRIMQKYYLHKALCEKRSIQKY